MPLHVLDSRFISHIHPDRNIPSSIVSLAIQSGNDLLLKGGKQARCSNMEMARHIIVDSKLDYPTTCNAMETLLIHEDLLSNDDFQELVLELKHEGTLFLHWTTLLNQNHFM
ncbi:uncharacterized protein LOC121992154 isoform X2 [Zingiber officinale]|uniref:uncharacterized protein LOC121992154 isoform X2 n=1 Tax=Zingiber officinale TaxID=94328 RepID=UPI001C4D90B3|nr:uncharacterized protein LOC121992154 isoform X2 [Zingiber officinale]